MLKARALHRHRDQENGWPAHFGRDASRAALVSGEITKEAYNKDLQVFRVGNKAKHGSSKTCWADIVDRPSADESPANGGKPCNDNLTSRSSFPLVAGPCDVPPEDMTTLLPATSGNEPHTEEAISSFPLASSSSPALSGDLETSTGEPRILCRSLRLPPAALDWALARIDQLTNENDSLRSQLVWADADAEFWRTAAASTAASSDAQRDSDGLKIFAGQQTAYQRNTDKNIEQINTQIGSLACSLGTQVEKSIDKRISKLTDATVPVTEIVTTLRAFVLEHCGSLVAEIQDNTTKTIADLLRKYDGTVAAQMDKLANALRTTASQVEKLELRMAETRCNTTGKERVLVSNVDLIARLRNRAFRMKRYVFQRPSSSSCASAAGAATQKPLRRRLRPAPRHCF